MKQGSGLTSLQPMYTCRDLRFGFRDLALGFGDWASSFRVQGLSEAFSSHRVLRSFPLAAKTTNTYPYPWHEHSRRITEWQTYPT